MFAQSFEEHLEQLGKVLSCLQEAGLKLKPAKCVLCRKKVKFLGHTVSAQGVEVDPSKVERVVRWPVPQNLTETKSFVGLCTYYHKFILISL